MATETTAVGETNRKVTNTTSITKGSKKRENIRYSQPDIEASKPKYSSGGSSALFQSRMGKSFRRPIYSKHNLRRVSDRVCTTTSKVFEGYNNSSSPGEGKEIMYDTGNKFSVGEKSNRNCSKFTNKCRVLFDSVSGRKENRRLPYGFKSKKPKQVYKNSAFQNGNFKVGRAFCKG